LTYTYNLIINLRTAEGSHDSTYTAIQRVTKVAEMFVPSRRVLSVYNTENLTVDHSG